MQIIQAILEAKPDLNLKDQFGQTALTRAASVQDGLADGVRELLRAGADANAKGGKGNTALIAAAEHGFADIVKALIAGGADVHLTNNDGDTALMVAAREPRDYQKRGGHVDHMIATPHGFDHPTVKYGEIVKALLDAGADAPSNDEIANTAGRKRIISMMEKEKKDGETVSWLFGGPSLPDNPEIIKLLEEARKKNERD